MSDFEKMDNKDNVEMFSQLAKRFGFLTSCDCEESCEECSCKNSNTQG